MAEAPRILRLPQLPRRDVPTGIVSERLRRNLLFENITDDEFASLRPLLAERRFQGGEPVPGAAPGSGGLYLIGDGRVKVVRPTRGGQDAVLAVLHHGDFFGDLELIDGRPRTSDVVALEPCVLYELPRKEFDRLLHENLPFTRRLLEVLSVRMRALSHQYAQGLDIQTDINLQELDKLRRLIEAAKTVNSTLDLDRLLDVILETALEIVDGDRGTLYLVDHDKKEIWSKIVKGRDVVEIRLPVGKGIAGYVAATGDVLNIEDAYLDSRFNPEVDERTGYTTKTILCVPMRNKEGTIIGVLQLLNTHEGLFTDDDAKFIDALSVHASIAIENARLYEQERRKQELEKELTSARSVQVTLLPKDPPVLEGFDIAGRSLSAYTVSGDYFDFIPLDEHRLAFCVGDVTGKGLPAALLMANIQAILRSQLMVGTSPKEVVSRSNKLLFRSTSPEKFVTLFYGVIDAQTNRMMYANAGHEFPLLIRDGVVTERLREGGTVLGIVDEYVFDEAGLEFRQGDVLVVFSDGVSEAMNAKSEQYTQERLEQLVCRASHRSAEEILQAILASVKEFSGDQNQTDDITVVVVKRLPALGGGR